MSLLVCQCVDKLRESKHTHKYTHTRRHTKMQSKQQFVTVSCKIRRGNWLLASKSSQKRSHTNTHAYKCCHFEGFVTGLNWVFFFRNLFKVTLIFFSENCLFGIFSMQPKWFVQTVVKSGARLINGLSASASSGLRVSN